MHYEVKVTCGALHVRSGPSVSYKIVGMVYRNEKFEVDDIKKYSDGEYWYKHKGKSVWSCGFRAPLNAKYLTVTRNFETENNPPKPSTPAPPPAPSINYDSLNSILGSNDNKGYLAPYDTDFNLELKGGYAGSGNNRYVDYQGSRSRAINENDYVYTDASFIKERLLIDKKNVGANYFSDFKELENKYFESFNRFNVEYPDYTLGKTFCKVFFTRPDLNLTNGHREINQDIINDPTFLYMFNTNRNILLSLTSEGPYGTNHKFNTFLSSRAESMEIADEVIKTEEVGENFVGYKVVYGKNNHESISAGTFSVNYTDSKRMIIYNIHKAWVEYISQVFKGMLSPRDQYKGTGRNILSRVIDYACCCYYFVLAEDGETILFGHKYYGVFPTNTPASSLSWSKGSTIAKPEISVTYAYWFREPINMLNMAEFNLLGPSDREYVRNYSERMGQCTETWVGAPFIEAIKSPQGEYVYKLRYRRDPSGN